MRRLPSDCLLLIFRRLPLRSCIQARQVCSRWRWLRSTIIKHLNSLNILIGHNAHWRILNTKFSNPYYSDYIRDENGNQMFKCAKLNECSSLEFDSINIRIVFGLTQMFPRVNTLKISLRELDYYGLILAIELMELLSSKLIRLELYCKLVESNRGSIPQHVSRQLCSVLNSMPALKHLTLEFRSKFAFRTRMNTINDYQTTSLDLPIISQLDEFNFYSKDHIELHDMLADSLQRYVVPNKGPLRIKYFTWRNLEKFDFLICERFTQISSRREPLEHAEVDILCDKFRSITSVWFNVDGEIPYFIQKLSQLTQLKNLSLSLWFSDFVPDDEVAVLQQLPSVLALRLLFRPTNHHDMDQLNLPWTFPNVQAMEIGIFDENRCDVCGYNREVHDLGLDELPDEVPLDTMKHCYSQILAQLQITLRQCTKLHTIFNLSAGSFKAASLPLTKEDLLKPIELIPE